VKRAAREVLQSFVSLPAEQRHALQRQLDDRNIAMLRLLAVESALIAFHDRKGIYPSELAELMPDYITTIPCDPFTGGSFKYRQTPSGFIVYSPGPTGQDLGGTFGDWLTVCSGEADLSVDMFDYYENS
jgi:hypothetical protein